MCVARSGAISILDLVNILHFGENEVIDLAKYIETTFAKIDESGDGLISSLEFTETVGYQYIYFVASSIRLIELVFVYLSV
jgi:hypothetical protein